MRMEARGGTTSPRRAGAPVAGCADPVGCGCRCGPWAGQRTPAPWRSGAWTGRPWQRPRAGLASTAPIAVTRTNRVVACSAAAREAGVRRGLRRREAQARCPQVHVSPADPARDARFFEGVVVAVDDVVPARRCCAGSAGAAGPGAARYFGTEQAAAERLVDAVAAGVPSVGSESPTSCPPPSSRPGRPHRGARSGCGLSVRVVDQTVGR